ARTPALAHTPARPTPLRAPALRTPKPMRAPSRVPLPSRPHRGAPPSRNRPRRRNLFPPSIPQLPVEVAHRLALLREDSLVRRPLVGLEVVVEERTLEAARDPLEIPPHEAQRARIVVRPDPRRPTHQHAYEMPARGG